MAALVIDHDVVMIIALGLNSRLAQGQRVSALHH